MQSDTARATRRRGAVVVLAVAALSAAGVSAATSASASTSPLVSAFSGKCLDVTGNSQANGTPVEIWDCNGRGNQTWTTTSAGELRTYGTSKCLAAQAGGTAAGTKLVIASCDSSSGQKFTLNPSGTITGTASKLCIDVTGANPAAGTAVTLWTCNGNTNQKWSTSAGGSSTPPTTTSTGGTSSAGVHGYATVNGSTTGGGTGPTVTVSSLSALTREVAKSAAETVRVNGTFTGSSEIKVASNKTIIGVGGNSGLVGAGLVLKGVSNVIVRNLTISFVKASTGTGDSIHIEKANHIWVDHNTLFDDQKHGKDYYDGLIDITHAADYITVSNNYLHDHYKAILIGHSDTNGAQDTGHLHVTLDHNYLKNINSRMPSLRFGTGHIYDNYFVNADTGIHSRENAQVLAQNNVFRDVSTPLLTTGDSNVDGYINQSGNDIGTGKNDISRTGSFTNPGYAYSLTATSSVISYDTANAGTGHI